MLSLLYARMRKIHSKLKALEWSQHFSYYKSMGIFPNAQGHVTHKSLFGSYLISNPSKILWVSLLPARMKKIQSKNEGARVVTTLFINFSDAQGQLTPKSVMESCPNLNSSELLWVVLLSAITKEIHPIIKVLEWSQHFSHYKSMGIFLDAKAQLTGQILPNFERIRDFMVVLVTCKNILEKPIKNEGARVVTRFFPL